MATIKMPTNKNFRLCIFPSLFVFLKYKTSGIRHLLQVIMLTIKWNGFLDITNAFLLNIKIKKELSIYRPTGGEKRASS